MDFSKFYANVEAERARRNWTIEKCSKLLGINEKTYRERIRVRKDLRMTDLMEYVTAFDCSADYLLGLSDKIHVS